MKKNEVFGGSSKLFYEYDNNSYLMAFKDDIHGNNRAGVIKGTGISRKEFTYYFFKYLEKKGIPTHLDETSGHSALTPEGLIVKKCKPVKIELLVRKVARGHWVDPHKIPVFEGGTIFEEPIVEFCLKMKKTLENGTAVDDPRINGAIAIALHKHAKDPSIRNNMIKTPLEVWQAEQLALAVYIHYNDFLQNQGWLLEDFKFEIGVLQNETLNGEHRQFVVIDEISPDCSRIRDHQGSSLTKDLFRQNRPDEEIIKNYSLLANAIKIEANKNVFASSVEQDLYHR